MQVSCKSTHDAADLRCAVCGQGFQLTWERHSKLQRSLAIGEIARTLRSHHGQQAGPSAHPAGGFVVQQKQGTLVGPVAAVTGHAPNWAL